MLQENVLESIDIRTRARARGTDGSGAGEIRRARADARGTDDVEPGPLRRFIDKSKNGVLVKTNGYASLGNVYSKG